jgi:hypothetical protein
MEAMKGKTRQDYEKLYRISASKGSSGSHFDISVPSSDINCQLVNTWLRDLALQPKKPSSGIKMFDSWNISDQVGFLFF